ncbi:Hydrogen peroxide-inducible genes activator [Candidatus Entotheonellaceae bacterium PAL068K]
MTLQELRYVVTLAETRHFGRAAQACYVSQPTLSTQIKKLEAELGVRLFERTNKRVMATPMGQTLISQARVILEEVDRLRQMAQQGRDPMTGPLRLGVIPTLGPYLLPHVVPQMRATYPQLRLYVREEITERLLEHLRTGALDALLLALPVHDDGLQAEELFFEPFVLACPAGDRLARKTRIRETDLLDASVLLLEDGHCLRDQALAVCSFPQPPGAEEFRASSLETLRQMVAAGIGCTLLPTLAASVPSLSDTLLALRPFATPAPSRTIGLVYRQGFSRTETVQALAELIRTQAPPGVIVIKRSPEHAPLQNVDIDENQRVK